MMITIGIIGSNDSEIEGFMVRAKHAYDSEIEFLLFEGDDLEKQAEIAARKAHQGEIDILMKGIVPTKTLLKGILKIDGIKDKKRFTHVAIIQLPQLNRPILLTDSGMNIAPTIAEHIDIIDQAVEVAINTGIKQPKVALLSSAEHHNPKMSSAVRAEELTKIYKEREDAIIYGPLSLDLALSKDSVRNKRFSGPIEGDADILVVPTIDVGNTLYKSLQLFSDAEISGLIVGAKIPIMLSSRNDSNESRLFSLKYAIQQIKSER